MKELRSRVNDGIRSYVEACILPRYSMFDKAHGPEHVRTVIEESLRLASFYDVSADMVYVIAAYHDLGLCNGRDNHHIDSGVILMQDERLRDWFGPDRIAVMREAVEDHRASAGHEPRSLYGRIVSEADRDIVPEKIFLRTVQFGLAHCPDTDKEAHYRRFREHMEEKYSERGYLKLWIPESGNAAGLAELRSVIASERKLRDAFEQAWLSCGNL